MSETELLLRKPESLPPASFEEAAHYDEDTLHGLYAKLSAGVERVEKYTAELNQV